MAPWVDFLLQMGSTAAEATVSGRKKAAKGRDPKIDVAHNTFASTRTINQLSFVEWRSIRGKEEEKSFNSIYWTATKYDHSLFYGLYYEASYFCGPYMGH